MKYTKAVGYKFNRDGSAIEFPGTTIISHLSENNPVHAEVIRIAEEAKKKSYSGKYTFLPPSSYHMTNKVLYNDHPSDRQGPGWSTKYPRNLSCELMNTAIAKDLHKIAARGEWPKSFRMRLWYVGDASLKLQPATTSSAESLRRFRDAVAEETGICWPDHDCYVYHITYAYRLLELTEKENQDRLQLGRRQAAHFRERFSEFDLPAGVFCTFRNMLHFEPYSPAR